MTRKTLKKPLIFHGIGLHTGVAVTLRLLPAEPGTGYQFRFGEREYPLSAASFSGDGRGTELKFAESSLRTVEHLLSALRGFDVDDIIIDAKGGETPLLDGSALEYCRALSETGFDENTGNVDPIMVQTPVGIESQDGHKSVIVIPCEKLRFTYIIDYPGCMIGTQLATVEPNAKNFTTELGQCRTFCLLSEVEQMRANGLGLGGTVENALIVDGGKLLTPGGLRRPDEFVRHKILDMMGDLALLGRPVIGHFIAIRAGHAMHLKLVERLMRTLPLLKESNKK